MLRNMVTSLMLHGQIRTTQARAKELRGYAEKVVTLAKKAPSVDAIDKIKNKDDLQVAKAARVHAIRRVRRWVNNDEAVDKLFSEYAARFANRPGGYTRVIKAGIRPGDNSDMAIIQLVGDYDPSAVKEAAPEPVVEAAPEEPAAAEAPVETAAEATSDESAQEETAEE
jgi:large subunit ribosomal protein L17